MWLYPAWCVSPVTLTLIFARVSVIHCHGHLVTLIITLPREEHSHWSTYCALIGWFHGVGTLALYLCLDFRDSHIVVDARSPALSCLSGHKYNVLKPPLRHNDRATCFEPLISPRTSSMRLKSFISKRMNFTRKCFNRTELFQSTNNLSLNKPIKCVNKVWATCLYDVLLCLSSDSGVGCLKIPRNQTLSLQCLYFQHNIVKTLLESKYRWLS